jgi:hypothetical protein
MAANVEENDYTVFTGQDLAFELELVVQAVGKKIAFVDNQVCHPRLSRLQLRDVNDLYRLCRATCRI